MKLLAPASLRVGLAHWRFSPKEDSLVLVAKASFALVHEGAAAPLEEPLPLRGDEFDGEDPLVSECIHGSDVVPAKARADLMLHGIVQSPDGRPQTAAFLVGDASLSLRVAPDQVGARARGFGPISPFDQSRATKWPAINQAWLDKGWPWAPVDLDYGYFNAAQPALQVDELRGDEVLRCENLHHEHRRFRCTLPGVRLRGFVVDRYEGKERFREAPLVLDTLDVDMVAETIALVWRGHMRSQSRDHEEVTHLYLTTETLAAPRLSADQHRQLFELQRSEEDAATRSPDVVGAGSNDNEPAPRPRVPKPKAPKSSALPEGLKTKILAMGTPVAALTAVEAGDTEGALEIFKKTFRMSGPDVDALMAEQHVKAREAHVKAGGDPKDFDAPAPKAPVEKPGKATVTPWSRERVAAAVIAKVSLAEVDLSGLDLTEMDLRGMNFSGAILAETKLSGSKLERATFDGADLHAAEAKGTSFREASFVEADLTGILAEGADFSRATLPGALLDDATLTRARFEHADMPKSSLRRAKLEHALLTKANLRGAILSEAAIGAANFVEANLDDAVAEGVVGEDVDFRKASLVKFRAGERSVLHRARLDGCQATRSRWMHADLTGADLRRTTLCFADLSRTNLSDAVLASADLEGADLTKAKLQRANLSNGDLAGAQLEEADLRQANLTGANLYQANVFLAKLDGAVLDGAFTSGTLLRPQGLRPETR